MINMTLFCSN